MNHTQTRKKRLRAQNLMRAPYSKPKLLYAPTNLLESIWRPGITRQEPLRDPSSRVYEAEDHAGTWGRTVRLLGLQKKTGVATCPKGPKYPVFEDGGSQNRSWNGCRYQTPQMLGACACTLWVLGWCAGVSLSCRGLDYSCDCF